MNRRSFIKRFAVAAAGLAMGASLLSESLTAKPVANSFDGLKFDPLKYKGEWKWVIDPNPLRYEFKDGKYVQVNPMGFSIGDVPNPNWVTVTHASLV